MLLWLFFCLWKAPALIVPSLLLFGLIAFIRYFRKSALAIISSVLILGILAVGIIYLLPNASTQQESVKTEDGTIKILPPKPNKEKDLISDKSITWWDFIQNKTWVWQAIEVILGVGEAVVVEKEIKIARAW